MRGERLPQKVRVTCTLSSVSHCVRIYVYSFELHYHSVIINVREIMIDLLQQFNRTTFLFIGENVISKSDRLFSHYYCKLSVSLFLFSLSQAIDKLINMMYNRKMQRLVYFYISHVSPFVQKANSQMCRFRSNTLTSSTWMND